ncbi:siderophore-interacting protein [Luedemannella helvata]
MTRLSPTFVRATFTGPDLDQLADNGFDQRIKLVIPLPGADIADMPMGPDWFAQWRALPDERRLPIRTYTVRAVRPAARELDVDLALHGEIGPASRWALSARPGDSVAIIGPNAEYDGEHGGLEFSRKVGTADLSSASVLLAGDETAVPAVLSIVERLPHGVSGTALLEVPHPDDALPVAAPPGLTVTWLARGERPHGELLVPAVTAAAARLAPALAGVGAGGPADLAVVDPDLDHDILWEVPGEPTGRLYGWIAGESGVVMSLRRQLLADGVFTRETAAFMGYWRRGRSES